VTVLLIIIGAAIGAPLRYFTDRAIQARHDSVFPWGTLAVNVVGSLLFGLLVGGAEIGGIGPEVITFAGVGFCGALTTYSTFGYETARLVGEGSVLYALVNAVVSVSAGVGAAFGGFALASALWS
jgi:CrcB protein